MYELSHTVLGQRLLLRGVTIMLLVGFIFKKERLLGRSPMSWSGIPAPYHGLHHPLEHDGIPSGERGFENGITGGWFAILLTMALVTARRDLRAAAVVAVPVTLIFMGYGYMVNAGGQPHAASLKSSWPHRACSVRPARVRVLLIASGLGSSICSRTTSSAQAPRARSTDGSPLAVIDELMFKFVVFGFLADAIMIASG